MQAFTLAELLMAVLVISIIMVALAPVITRRAYDTVSIETNRKKGEEIWTNPGTYTFQVPAGIGILQISGSGGGGGGAGGVSKQYSRTYNAKGTKTITVPKGVSQITFTLYGAGGGGGGANAAKKTDNCKYSLILPAFADNGRDLCVSTYNQTAKWDSWVAILYSGEQTVRNDACWITNGTSYTGWNDTTNRCSLTSRPTASPYFAGGGCRKMVCTKKAATTYCELFSQYFSGEGSRSYRLITVEEFERLWAQSTPSNNYRYMFGQGLDLGIHIYDPATLGNRFTKASEYLNQCRSAVTNTCTPYQLHLKDGIVGFLSDRFLTSGPSILTREDAGEGSAAQVRCVRELNNWDQYSGAGGSRGAILTKTINVQPGDTLTFTTGDGGLGGSKGGGTGSQGGSTCLEHKRNGSRYTDPANTSNNGYYCAYGGYGGKGATTSANGQPNSTLAACSHTDGCTKSTNGNAGTSSQGGKGANGPDGATADLGQNSVPGVGFDSTNVYSGGSGGYCPRGNRTPSNCQKGGKGGVGGFNLTYYQYMPGGAGGAGGAAGTDEDANYKPIKLKVEGGETITFTIGAGGSGGQVSSKGADGQDTVIARKGNNNVFTFYAGKGGNTGNFSSTCKYDNQACGIGGLGGDGGRYPNPSLTPNSFSYLNPNTKAKGTQGGLDTKGFFGGHGGSTPLIKTGSCGGYEVDTSTSCAKYDAKGNDGSKHNPITNRLGGAGGGGAGTDGKQSGEGGSGGSGYIRIKWDESEE